ncbi:MAG: glycosyltransferase [Phreatobacter sp.]|uniref:glycosyltransferase n=1 Tax=Phreatobacter sp. TaxID=1966341 RepID=UPI001A3E278F|nr:glycosyltransferase [Phreatobacter sp.]MBL8571882.1 glycosyltransferase [Phreatobacter sp.]
MRFLFVDDSFAFDGYSPSSQPMAGPEKAFALLPGPLVQRGHEATVFNRTTYGLQVDGARWEPFETERPADTDVLVALRKPELLDFVTTATKRVLWCAGDPAELDGAANRPPLERHRPLVLFFSKSQLDRWANPLKLEARVFETALATNYLDSDPMRVYEPPRAVTTAHPQAGLGWLLPLWIDKIRPQVPNAELHVYSALLNRGILGGEVAPGLKPLVDLVNAARDRGILVMRPQGDSGMADSYRAARAFLYPGMANETYGFTLAESQALGLPAVVRPMSAVLAERVVDGETGWVAGNETQFAAKTIELLQDRAVFDRMSARCRELRRGRTWPIAAAEFEGLVG